VSCTKTAEPVEMLFGIWTPVGPRKHVLGGGVDAAMGRGTFSSDWLIKQHCKAEDFGGLGKIVSYAKTSGTICMSYDVFLHKEVPFVGCDHLLPFMGQIPQKPPFLGHRHFQAILIKYSNLTYYQH